MSMFKFTAASVLLVAGYATFATSANANTLSQLNKCRFDSKQKTVECCQRVFRDEGSAKWLLQGGNSCQKSVACINRKGRGTGTSVSYVSAGGGKIKRYCYVKIELQGREGGQTPPPHRDQPQQRGGRTFN
jgi:hypothetical protein